MKIKKMYSGVVPNGKILNQEVNSQIDTYSCSYLNDKLLDNYSTEEQVIGTWIDGKPIYRKVIRVANKTLSNEVTLDTDILNMKELTNASGVFTDGSKSVVIKYPIVENDGKIMQMYVSKDGTKIGFLGNSRWSSNANRVHTFTLEYTKTTD